MKNVAWGNRRLIGQMIAIVLLCCVGGCASAIEPPDKEPLADVSCAGAGANTFYFPAGVFDVDRSDQPDDDFERRWYSSHLVAMREPSLSCGNSTADETYRFLWLRSFHPSMAVRISRTGHIYQLTAIELSGKGGYEPGHIAQKVRRELDEVEWQSVMRSLKRISFWDMSTKPPPTNEIGVDGAEWIIEGRAGGYHVVDRWSGDDGVAEVGRSFLKLADIPVRGPIY